MSRNSPVGVALVLGAATLWGVGGLFARAMIAQGLSPAQAALFANGLSLLVLVVGLLVVAPRYLRIHREALPSLLSVGVFGGGLAFFCYTSAIARASLGLAAVLMYTSPAWVTLLAWRFLGEGIGPRRVAAVAAACIGVALVAQAYDPAALRGSLAGVLFGLTGGLSYAIYIVLSKGVLRRHHPLTVTTYGYVGAVLVLLPVQPLALPTDVPGGAWPWLALYVVGSQVVGNVAYNSGLRRVPAGLVSVLALWSPITTLALSALVLGEALSPPQLAGALLVIGSVVAMRPEREPTDAATPGLAAAAARVR